MASHISNRETSQAKISTYSCLRSLHCNRAVRNAFLSVALFQLVCFYWTNARAQQQGVPPEREVIAVPVVLDFIQLAQREAAAPARKPERKVVPFMPMPPRPAVPAGVPIRRAVAPLPPAPTQPPPFAPSPAPALSFLALDDDDTFIPPDTQGAVGPNHLMVTLNRGVRIQDRLGAALSTVSLDSFWISTGATGVFDPRVVYDPFNNRWIFASASNAQSATSSVVVGVTQTSDPTGKWNLYRITADSGGMNWADFPSLGFNKDWVVVTVNMFGNVSGAFRNSQIFVGTKSALYEGNSATFRSFTEANGFTQAPAVTYDNALGTMYLVDDFNGNFGGNGTLRISTITGTVGSEVYSAGTVFPTVANTWASQPAGGADFAPQMGTSNKIQNGDSRMLKVIYRNGSLWAAQNAFLPASKPTRTAAQWWQLKPDGTVQQFGRVDDPTGVLFFAYPTIAVNAQNDALLGYSRFSASQFASADYSVRFASDPPNTMRSDVLLKAGEALYFKTFGDTQNRWGDYSNTVVDPVNDVDMWTIQEYASSPNFSNGDNRWGTWWGKITPQKKRRGQLISQ
jgi:hypothetical protein